MSAESAAGDFGGHQESRRSSGQKSRLLPAGDGVMSAEIAFGNFSQ
jgi:hypothetical protein